MTEFRTVCPLNCFDSCSLIVKTEAGVITAVGGDPEHPITRGYICPKGKALAERVYSPDRVTHPLLKRNGAWTRIDWTTAYEIWAEKLVEAKTKFGSQSILHHFDYGSNGVLRNLDRRFFNVFGGVTIPSGSLCWGSGIAAQLYDFGGYYSHSWADLVNSRTIILWGRDPVVTNLHLLPFLKEAKENGAQIIVINPVRVKSADLADTYLSPRPGTDGALALGMAHEILNQRLMDLNFIQDHVHGFAEYAHMVKDFSPQKVAEITGISAEEICDLARTYAKHRPAAILCGYGMQRYTNGGQTVRAINALGVITGNVSLPGGGVNYAHQYNKDLFNDLTLPEAANAHREIPFPLMGRKIPELSDPPIRVAVVTRSNPVTQHPDTTAFLSAFRSIDFKVTVDFHLTDTAEESDLFLPCTTIFEEEDLIATSWNEYIGYAPKIIEPRGEAKPDPVIFAELAGCLGLGEFFAKSPRDFIDEALQGNSDLTVEKLASGPIRTPFAQDVAWVDKKFLTPSGKVELYSAAAAAATGEGTARYIPPQESGSTVVEGYPLYFLTPHPAKALHSQFSSGEDNYPGLEIHPTTANAYNLREGNLVMVESPRGQLVCRTKLNDRLREDTVQAIEGQWLKFGGGVNFLTPGFRSDMGDSVPYYDCRCQLRKYLLD